jgi:hypothetical protein
MATATGKVRCATCDKEKPTLRCIGCLKDFCYDHLGEHRQQLNKQLDDIEVHRDIFRQTLTEQTIDPNKRLLIQQINKWEQESIEKIKQTAEEGRQLLLKHTNNHITRIEQKLNKLNNQFRLSRKEDNFIEIDLQEWKKELQQMTDQLNKPSHIKIYQDSTTLINKIHVFGQSILCIFKIRRSFYLYETNDKYEERIRFDRSFSSIDENFFQRN